MVQFMENFINQIFKWLFSQTPVNYMFATVIVLAMVTTVTNLFMGKMKE